MRSILLITFVSLLVACTPKKSTQNSGNQSVDQTGDAKFEFQEEMHNFGDLKAGEVVAFSFSFENTGDVDLLIEKVEADCGCINIEYPREKVAPGESGYIEVVFNSAGEVGRVYKTLTLFSNAGKTELAIAATVDNEMLNLYSKN